MALNKLYYVYGLDTACFYTDEENEIEKKILKSRHLKKLIKDRLSKNTDSYEKQQEHSEEDDYSFNNLKEKTKHQLSFLNQYINRYKTALKNLLNENVGIIRTVRNEKIYDKKGVITSLTSI